MAHGVVGGSLGELAAVQMGDRDAGEQGGAGGGQGLVAVAQKDEQIGPFAVERFGDAGERRRHGARDAELGVVVEGQRHACGDTVAVAFDLVDGQAEARREVRAGDDQRGGKAGLAGKLVEQGLEEPVLGPRAGQDGDPVLRAHGSGSAMGSSGP